MARDTSKLVTIPGELHSAATGNIVSASQEIFDYDSNSYQSQLNKQTYNVSAHGDTSLTYTLETAIAAVPDTYHVGGLIITFVNEIGEFNMYQLGKKDWSSNVNDWSCIYATAENPEFVDVHLDSSGHILYGVRMDGDFYFGAGIPSQIQSEIDSVKREIDDDVKASIDNLERRVDSSFNEIDASLSAHIEDSSVRFANIDSSLNDLGFYQNNPEFVEAHIDSSSKILYGVRRDGDFYFGAGIPSQIKDEFDRVDASIHELGFYEDNPEFVKVNIDSSNKILYGVRKDGDFYFGGGVPSQIKSELDVINNKIDNDIEEALDQVDASINELREEIDSSISARINELGFYEDNPEFVKVSIDSSSKLLYGVRTDGDFYFGAGVPSQILNYVNEKGEKIDASILEIETRFYNVNAHDGSIGINYTLEKAIAAVPEEYRNGGLILTFNSDGSNVIYQDSSVNWSEDVNDWTQYTSKKYVDLLKTNVDSSISELKYKTSDIQRTLSTEDEESIILATDDNTEVTKIFAEKINDDKEGIIITTDNNIEITRIDFETQTIDDSEVIEFGNENSNEVYAKIGTVDGSSGIFVDNLYDLNGNILLQFDSSNDILIIKGKKFKMIPYIEET
jgi:hypothetical protein